MSLNRRAFFRAASAAGLFISLPSLSRAQLVPSGAGELVLLSFNENALGMSAKAKQAAAAALERGSRYPFQRVEALRAECAKFMGGKPENIMLSHGSAESIRACVEAYLTPETQLVIPELTYSDGEDTARKNGITRVVKVPMGPKWSIDIQGMKKAVADYKGPSIVYFVNPNNPTSTIVDSAVLNDWIKSRPARTMFLVDEAYAEFVNDPSFVSTKTLVDAGYDNVAVLKTFSKIFAMAGMRLGFTYATPEVIKKVTAHVAYDIMMNIASIEAAIAEINDQEFLALSRRQNDEAKAILIACLDELGIEYLPSQANFILMNLKAPLKPFADRMLAEKILVGRPFPPATEWCRVSMGTPDQMRLFVSKLKEFRAKGWV